MISAARQAHFMRFHQIFHRTFFTVLLACSLVPLSVQAARPKGAVFLRQLRHEVGDKAFFRTLQAYFQQHRYGVAATADVQHAFEAASGRDLAALFRTWVQP
jgi:hypothetical protein